MSRFEQDFSPLTRGLETILQSVRNIRSEFDALISGTSRVEGSLGSQISKSASAPTGEGTMAFLTASGQNQYQEFLNKYNELATKIEKGGPNEKNILVGLAENEQRATYLERIGKGMTALGNVGQFDAGADLKSAIEAANKRNTQENVTRLDIAYARAQSVAKTSPNTQLAEIFGNLNDPTALIDEPRARSNRQRQQNASAMDMFSKSYGLGDLPRLMNTQGEMGGILDSLKKFQESGQAKDDVQILVLKNLERAIKENSEKFNEAVKVFKEEASKGEVSPQALENLRRESRNLDTLKERSEEVDKQIGFGGSGGGGGGGPSFLDRMFRSPQARAVGGALGMVTGAGLAAYGLYYNTTQNMGNVVSGAPLRAEEMAGGVGELQYKRELEQYNLTNPENLLKTRGDLLLGNRSQYLGTSGRINADRVANEMVGFERNLQKRAYNNASIMGVAGGIGDMFSSGLQGAAVGAVAGSFIPVLGTGLGAIIGGLGGAAMSGLNSTRDVFNQQINNPYAQEQGLDSGLTGAMGRFAFGPEFSRLSKEAQRAVLEERELKTRQISDSLREAEMKKFLPEATALGEVQSMYGAQKTGAIGLGRYATTRAQMDSMYGTIPTIPRPLAVKPSIQNRTTFKDDFSPKMPGYDGEEFIPGMTAAENKYVGDTKLDSIAQGAYEVAKNKYLKGPDTLLTQLDMSASEFMGSRNLLSGSVLGGQASVADTVRMIKLGRGGFGSQDQIAGNLNTLNQTLGGDNNLNKLEQIFGNAVAIGFDKSRLAQSFTQTTTQLASTLGLTDTNTLAGQLGTAATFASLGGKRADERGLREAARGIEALEQSTARTDGIMGAVKGAAIFGAGVTMQQGAAVYHGLGIAGTQNLIKDFNSGKLTNTQEERLLAVTPGATKSEQMREASRRAQIVLHNMLIPLRSDAFNRFEGGQKGYESELDRIRGLKGKEKEAAELQLIRAFGIAGEGTVEGAQAYQVVAQEDLKLSSGLTATQSQALAHKTAERGNATYVDPASQSMRRFIDGTLRQLNIETSGGLSIDQYKQYLAGGGTQSVEFASKTGRKGVISQKDLNSEDSDTMDAVKQSLMDVDRQSFIRNASMQIAQAEGAQSVRISNVVELARSIAEATKAPPGAVGERTLGK